MLDALHRRFVRSSAWKWPVAALALLAAARLGLAPSRRWLSLLLAAMIGAAVLVRPVLGPFALVLAALVLPMEFSTGTQVSLNRAALLLAALLLVWLASSLVRQRLELASSRVNAPLLGFLALGLLSLLAGNVLWDPGVPRPHNMLAVQMAQWAIFALSAGALWLAGSVIEDQAWLRRLTLTFLGLGGCLALARLLPVVSGLIGRFVTVALNRPPFWLLLTALAGGQLLFNRQLAANTRRLLVLLLVIVAFYAFIQLRESVSTWVGVAATAGVLIWLRWPRFRWPVILLLTALSVNGLLQSAVWEFAGGEREWILSGGSRLALIERVVQVTMRNPITGLGPASYRPYANQEPLAYRRALWINPKISSHNNYVDLFAQTGVLGLTLFFWFAVELARLGLRLRTRFREGFAAGYVNGMLAAGAGSLVIMLLADWILPFVYNIGFPGFQASVLVWLFMGGLVALDHLPDGEAGG